MHFCHQCRLVTQKYSYAIQAIVSIIWTFFQEKLEFKFPLKIVLKIFEKLLRGSEEKVSIRLSSLLLSDWSFSKLLKIFHAWKEAKSSRKTSLQTDLAQNRGKYPADSPRQLKYSLHGDQGRIFLWCSAKFPCNSQQGARLINERIF